MLATKERIITSEFLGVYINQPKPVVIEHLASISQESNRIPDPWSYLINPEGKICDNVTGRPVEEIISRGGYIGRVEGFAFDTVSRYVAEQRLAEIKDRRPIAWVSPPYQGKYPDLKIIVSELEEDDRGNQILFNRAVILDFDEKQSLEFAQKLVEHSKYRPLIQTTEDIRRLPLILNSTDWVSILEGITPSEQWNLIRTSKDKRLKQEALKKARVYYEQLFENPLRRDQLAIVANMSASGFIGQYSISCPPETAFAAIFKGIGGYVETSKESKEELPAWRKNDKDPDYCVHCGACGEVIKQVVRHGEPCPAEPRSCGAVRRC